MYCDKLYLGFRPVYISIDPNPKYLGFRPVYISIDLNLKYLGFGTHIWDSDHIFGIQVHPFGIQAHNVLAILNPKYLGFGGFFMFVKNEIFYLGFGTIYLGFGVCGCPESQFGIQAFGIQGVNRNIC